MKTIESVHETIEEEIEDIEKAKLDLLSAKKALGLNSLLASGGGVDTKSNIKSITLQDQRIRIETLGGRKKLQKLILKH